MDIKLGRSSLTKNVIRKGESFIAARKAKDETSTAAQLGFCICGYVILD